MGLDIRMPIGLMFSVIGLMLAGFGTLSNRAIYARSLGVNINLIWGLVLLVFGIIMLVLGLRGGARLRSRQQAKLEVPVVMKAPHGS